MDQVVSYKPACVLLVDAFFPKLFYSPLTGIVALTLPNAFDWLNLPPSLPFQLITYFAGRVYDPNEAERGRVAFAGEYLKGDASVLIRDLSLGDTGEYSCKVKNGGNYHWSTINLIVLGKPLLLTRGDWLGSPLTFVFSFTETVGRWQRATGEEVLAGLNPHQNI